MAPPQSASANVVLCTNVENDLALCQPRDADQHHDCDRQYLEQAAQSTKREAGLAFAEDADSPARKMRTSNTRAAADSRIGTQKNRRKNIAAFVLFWTCSVTVVAIPA